MIFSAGRLGKVLAVLACLASGCADFSRGGAVPDADVGDVANSDAVASFATEVHGILTSACQRCHASGQEAGDTRLILTGVASTDYTVVKSLVDTSAPASSRLLVKMSGSGHGGGKLYAVGTPQYQTVLLWIQQGAPL